jgi:hypothetical protein
MPTFKLTFGKGNYTHALNAYQLAHHWIESTGLAVQPDVRGTVNRPHHRKCPASERMVPEWLLNVDGWSVSSDLHCGHSSTAEWIKSLPLPEGARLAEIHVSQSACFTLQQAEAASEWRFNCGPGALCAALRCTPADLRPHLHDFEAKGYTNPTLMRDILAGLGVKYRLTLQANEPQLLPPVKYGLMRVQWAGPWTEPGVPMAARYRQTHWVAIAGQDEDHPAEVFDVNAIAFGGWLTWYEWSRRLVPWLIREAVPKGNGEWWPTHILELDTESLPTWAPAQNALVLQAAPTETAPAADPNTIVALFADGGLASKNPSPIGGVWAWCGVNANNERIIQRSGFTPPGKKGTVSNNNSELIALVLALEAMPEGWTGKVCSDSKVALGILFWNYKDNSTL